MEISKKLKLLRETHNLTQEELASKLKLSRSAISNYESGTRTPDIETLYSICNFYNITLDSFFSDDTVHKVEKKKTPNKVIYSIIITLVVLVMLIVIIPNIIKDKHQYGYDINNDELKVNNCDNISIIKFLDSNDDKTYEVEISNILKGKPFKYVTIHNKDISVNLDKHYLIFGNETKFEDNNNNYVSIDNVSIYDHQFIYEIEDYNSKLDINNQIGEAKTLLDYYTYYIDIEPKDEKKFIYLDNIRNEEIKVDDKNQYNNSYDLINLNLLNENTNVMNELGYKFMDFEITMKTTISNNINPSIYIYNKVSNNDIDIISSCTFNNRRINEYSYNKITFFLNNIKLDYFCLDNNSLVIRYGYESMFTSSWTNSEIDIKIGLKK